MGEERYNHCVAVCWNRFKMTEFVTQETEDAKRSQFMGEERYNHCVAVCWNHFKMTEFVTQETEDAK